MLCKWRLSQGIARKDNILGGHELRVLRRYGLFSTSIWNLYDGLCSILTRNQYKLESCANMNSIYVIGFANWTTWSRLGVTCLYIAIPALCKAVYRGGKETRQVLTDNVSVKIAHNNSPSAMWMYRLWRYFPQIWKPMKYSPLANPVFLLFSIDKLPIKLQDVT